MTSAFEKLPYEILDYIAEYLSKSKDDLHQLQLTNKRCQFVAEKHLFKELILSNRATNQYKLFSAKPQRCGNVRTLRLNGEPSVPLDDSFFDRFCNIERVYYDYEHNFSWQCFSETFTPERCRLRELPLSDFQTDDIEPYFETLQNHSFSLEKLDLTKPHPLISALFIRNIEKYYDLPRLKSLSFFWTNPKLQDLDATIDKYPRLEELEMGLYTEERVDSWAPARQHQQFMEKVSFSSFTTNFFSLCNYFIAKFPNVRKWEVVNFVAFIVNRERDIAPFEAYLNSLHYMMKSAETEFKILTTYASIPKYFEFLESYGAHTNISIDYQLERAVDDSAELVILMLRYSQMQSTLNEATLMYVSETTPHLDFLQKFGHHVQKLKLVLSDDVYLEEVDDILQGGALAHLLENCPALTSLEYHAFWLSPIHLDENKVNKSLKKMVLECKSHLELDALESISLTVPNLEDLTVVCDLGDSFSIYMLENNFDRLVLRLNRFSQEHKDRNILIEFILMKSYDDEYYVQTCNEGKREQPVEVSRKEFLAYSELPHTMLTIMCGSVNYLEYSMYCDSSNGYDDGYYPLLQFNKPQYE